jgi:hypothetical protein
MSEKANIINLNETLKPDQEDSVVKDESINTEEKPKMSQKAENLFRALREFVDENNGDVFFDINFGSLDESGDMSENHRITYGDIHKILRPNQDGLAEKYEMSQEAENIFKALDEYVKKHNYNAFFHVDFGAIDTSGNIFDDNWDIYGPDELTKNVPGRYEKAMKLRLETED